MAEALLVNPEWKDVSALRELLAKQDRRPLLEAVFVDPDGDWRLVTAWPRLDITGTRPIYKALDSSVAGTKLNPKLLTQLVLLNSADPDAQILASAPIADAFPPRRFDVELPSLPTFRGAVIARDPHLERMVTGFRLEHDVRAALTEIGVTFELEPRLPIGWGADFRVERHPMHAVLVEVKVADKRSAKSRIRDAAGLANMAACPVVLVLALTESLTDAARQFGLVPVFIVDWAEGKAALQEALKAADEWFHKDTLPPSGSAQESA